MNIISTLANGNFLQLEAVLNQNVQDVFAYLLFLSDKSLAEEAQYNFQKKLNDAKRK